MKTPNKNSKNYLSKVKRKENCERIDKSNWHEFRSSVCVNLYLQMFLKIIESMD